MNTPDPEPLPNTFEVEISALPADEGDEPEDRQTGAGRAAQAPLSPRARARRVALVASAFLVLLVVILGSLPGVRNQVVGVVQSFIPTPTPTLAPGTDRFYIAADVPWTTVTLDGHAIALPRIGSAAPLRLARGRHTLAWTAAPFQPQRCRIDVPYTAAFSCPIIGEARQGTAGPAFLVIGLQESLDTLPASQQQALLQTAQTALSGFSDIVQPGESYFVEPGGDTIIRQPIRATLTMQLATDSDAQQACTISLLAPPGYFPCSIEGQVCTTFCSVPWQERQTAVFGPAAQDWLAFGVIHSSWDFATLNGQSIARDQPPDNGRAPDANQPVLLRIGWDGSSWHVQPLFGPDQGPPVFVSDVQIGDIQVAADPGCLVAEDIFSEERENYARMRFVSGPNPAVGCLVEATVTSPPGTPTPSAASIEYYLVRFGDFLAANDLAHRHMPYYTLADAYEQQLARKLAALPGGLVVTPL